MENLISPYQTPYKITECLFLLRFSNNIPHGILSSKRRTNTGASKANYLFTKADIQNFYPFFYIAGKVKTWHENQEIVIASWSLFWSRVMVQLSRGQDKVPSVNSFLAQANVFQILESFKKIRGPEQREKCPFTLLRHSTLSPGDRRQLMPCCGGLRAMTWFCGDLRILVGGFAGGEEGQRRERNAWWVFIGQ